MSVTNHRHVAGARPASARPFAAFLALVLGAAGCAGVAASGHGGDDVPPLQPFQIRTVQRDLALRGLQVEPTGELDEPTRSALAEFQGSKRLPRTGLPDFRTLRELGIDPDPRQNCEMNNTIDCYPPPN